MRRKAAFTLVEMLAVIGIILVLMTISFGMFSMFSEQIGPESVTATVQAVINRARDYAASNGVRTLVVFQAKDQGTLMEGTMISVKFIPTGGTTPETIPGLGTISLRNQVFILKGIPDISGLADSLPASNRLRPTPEDAARWRQYEQNVLDKVRDLAVSGSTLKTEHEEFYIEFGPAGYPPTELYKPSQTVRPGDGGLTVVRLAGGRVASYAFFPLNMNAGTRLVFE